MANGGLLTTTTGKMARSKPIDVGMRDRFLAEPTAEVLRREHILMKRVGPVSASDEVVDILPKNWTDRVADNSGPHGRTTKDLIHLTPSSLPGKGEEGGRIMRSVVADQLPRHMPLARRARQRSS